MREAAVSRRASHVCLSGMYCNAKRKKNHWQKHKKDSKLPTSDEALFKDPPPKQDCPICFLPMPVNLICCVLIQFVTISSVPIYDFAIANEELSKICAQKYYPCCGEKNMCLGCAMVH